MNKLIKRGELWLVDFGKSDKLTHKQLGIRPCIILQNDIGNTYSPTTTVIPLSSNISKVRMSTHVILNQHDGVIKPSFAMLEQIQTIDKTDLIKKLGAITEETMSQIGYAAMIQLGLVDCRVNVNAM